MYKHPRDESPEWDKTTASIASLSSDDLNDSRPNRWRGPKSTWRTLTQEDRSVYEGLEASRRGDLAVHLYDAFALKGKRRKIGDEGELGDYEEDEDGRWLPPRGWTSWPVNPRDVPPDDLMPVQPLDEDSRFTYRKRDTRFPRSGLVEEIEAQIIRLAKERFEARESDSEGDSDGEGGSQEFNNARPRRSTIEPKQEHESKHEHEPKHEPRSTAGSEPDSGSEAEEWAPESDTSEMRGVPAADDDISSAILRPAVSDIVSRLEKTLGVLHNMMVATIQAADDDGEDGEETGIDEPTTPRPSSRLARSRSRSRPTQRIKRPRSRDEVTPSPESEYSDATRLGSPMKKPRHFGLPPSGQGNPVKDEVSSDSDPIKDEPSSGSDPIKDETSSDSASSDDSSPYPEPRYRPGVLEDESLRRARALRRLNRLRPRDWRSVLGAASLAGFSHAALCRATQRCANLFGEGLDLQLLNDHDPARDTHASIVPGGDILSEEDDDDELVEVTRMRLSARDSARAERPPSAPGSGARTPLGSETPSRTRRSRTSTPAPALPRSRSNSRSRSRSRSATPHLVCPYRSCPRSVASFSRRGGLLRHMELVHGDNGRDFIGMEIDSEDEVEGGVHVDGFLRPVRVRRGWRGEDVNLKRGGGEEERGRRGAAGVKEERRGTIGIKEERTGRVRVKEERRGRAGLKEESEDEDRRSGWA
ncbi:uncharacterized protein DNG_05096 [Cephalotrichum gorgonifer]|uniref:Rrn9 domain-containing protein n=1 Tax=Cephalotrichum gorgonifer TaxID=2041049 RepID=A0AAE8MZT6_9PEZI|nr:uncharacterized protein DNG_05096 [Cephalotrichum gorgonifer]